MRAGYLKNTKSGSDRVIAPVLWSAMLLPGLPRGEAVAPLSKAREELRMPFFGSTVPMQRKRVGSIVESLRRKRY